MPTLKYQGIFENDFRSGFVSSPNSLQQANSKFFGLVINWDGPSDGLNLTYKVGFNDNTFLNGLLNPNTLILSGNQGFITTVQVNIKSTGFFSFFSSPSFTVKVTDANGNSQTGGNGQVIRMDNGITSFCVEFA